MSISYSIPYTREDVQAAVGDPEWQEFRKSLKGMDTASKLRNLKDYYNDQKRYYENVAERPFVKGDDILAAQELGFIDIRVDNYLKALARGGLLYPGVSLDQAIAWDWNLRIKR